MMFSPHDIDLAFLHVILFPISSYTYIGIIAFNIGLLMLFPTFTFVVIIKLIYEIFSFVLIYFIKFLSLRQSTFHPSKKTDFYNRTRNFIFQFFYLIRGYISIFYNRIINYFFNIF